jgi:hypothetical protein
VVATQLAQTVRDLDQHVSAKGWDQPTRLFAVAETAALLEQEPELATQLSGRDTQYPFTTIEQEGFPLDQDLDEMLSGIAWPSAVAGAAICTERVMVTPGELANPNRKHEVRVTMVVLRDGSRCTALRLRDYDADDAVIVGEELVSGLGDLLLYTLSPEH